MGSSLAVMSSASATISCSSRCFFSTATRNCLIQVPTAQEKPQVFNKVQSVFRESVTRRKFKKSLSKELSAVLKRTAVEARSKGQVILEAKIGAIIGGLFAEEVDLLPCHHNVTPTSANVTTTRAQVP